MANMSIFEALRIMGMKEADLNDRLIALRYRELAQLLHPDKFHGNDKLQARASEQFKLVTQAKHVLLEAVQSRSAGAQSAPRSADAAHNAPVVDLQKQAREYAEYTKHLMIRNQIELEEERKMTSAKIMIGGLIAGILLARVPVVAVVAGCAFVWGLIGIISAHMQIKSLTKIEKETAPTSRS